MTARQLIQHAAHKAGLATAATISAQVETFGYRALNRIYSWVWHQYPYRDARLFDVALTVDTGEVILPVHLDAVRSVRSNGVAVYPVGAEISMEHGLGDAGNVLRYINLGDGPTRMTPEDLYHSMVADLIAAVGSDFDEANLTFQAVPVVSDEACAIQIMDSAGVVATFAEMTAAAFLEDYAELRQVTLTQPDCYGAINYVLTLTVDGVVQYTDTQALAEITHGQTAAYRRIQLIPDITEAVTIYVHGVRRFRPLLSLDEAPLLPRAENAMFDYLVAEFYEFDDNADKAGAERAKAGEELKAAVAWQTEVDREDHQTLPERSAFE